MGVLLSDLVDELELNVAALNGVPSDAQYELAVKDAVRLFSMAAARVKLTTLDVVAGTASYELPADFLKIVKLKNLGASGGLMITSDGLIPLASGFRERLFVNGKTLTFDPTPTYTLTRKLIYRAGHVLNEDNEYEEMTDEEAALVRLKAQAIALGFKANSVAENAVSYTIGDESFRKEGQAKAISEQVAVVTAEYEKGLKAYIGTHTQRATYEESEYGTFARDARSVL